MKNKIKKYEYGEAELVVGHLKDQIQVMAADKAQVTDYVIKPFSADVLSDKVKNCWPQNRREPGTLPRLVTFLFRAL